MEILIKYILLIKNIHVNPYIFVKVNSTVRNDDAFANKTRIEGYDKTYMVWDEDDHTTKIYEKEVEIKKLPKTGM